MNSKADSIAPLREFVVEATRHIELHQDEASVLRAVSPLLSRLLANDGWLPDAFAKVDPLTYKQYLLYCDPFERFSVVSFVWGPGHCTPIHDHTIWGLVGVLRGIETCQEYRPGPDQIMLPASEQHSMTAGMIDRVSPTLGDWHVVSNTSQKPAVSIHVYGANIGAVRRHVFDPKAGKQKPFISGYSLPFTPNLWDRSTA